MLKLIASAALVLLAGCATTKDITVSDRVKAACDEEGGCTLFTARAFMAKLEEAFAAGFQAAMDAAKQQRGAL
jgi:hypothetical protein